MLDSTISTWNYEDWSCSIRGWPRALIWESIGLCKVDDHPEAMVGAKEQNVQSTMIIFCTSFCINLSWFNIQLATKSYRWQFSIFMQNISFSFSTNFENQIRFPQVVIPTLDQFYRSAPSSIQFTIGNQMHDVVDNWTTISPTLSDCQIYIYIYIYITYISYL